MGKHWEINRALSWNGCPKADLAMNAEEGIAMIENAIVEGNPYDLLISDMHFWVNGEDNTKAGLHVIEELKRRGIDIHIMPNITPHVCRHTYCSNQAKAGMNPKTLQYLMGHSDISVTMNVYTHINFDDAEEELRRMEEFRKAQAEIENKNPSKPTSQVLFKVI